MHQQVTQFPNTHTYIYIYNFHCHLKKQKTKQKTKQKRDQFKNTHYTFLLIQCNMQYAESLHEIVIRRIHYDSRTSYVFIKCVKCVHYVHVTQTTGYHTILTILIQIFHIFSQIHILFSKPLFCFLRCVQTQRKKLCFHSFLFDKYKT